MHVRSLGWEDPLEEELATPLQYFCLKNPMDKKKKKSHGQSLGLQSIGLQSQTRLTERASHLNKLINKMPNVKTEVHAQ